MIPKTTTLLLTLALTTLTTSAQDNYQLDTKKSKILWNTGKMFGGHNGYLLLSSGSLQYTAAGEPSTGSFIMDIKSIQAIDQPSESNNKRTSEELQGADFFEGDKYPTATIQLTKISRATGPNQYSITGNLTIRGITHPVSFYAVINTDAKAKTATATADVSIHRTKWNIHAPKQKQTDFMNAVLEATDINVSVQLVLAKQ